MNTTAHSPRGSLAWAAVTTAGAALAGAIFFSVHCMVMLFGTFFGFALLGSVGGLTAFGLAWVAPGLPATSWAARSAVGWCLGFGMGLIGALALAGGLRLSQEAFGAVVAALVGLIAGGMIGMCQWSAVRDHGRQALLWMPVSALALAAGLVFAATLYGEAGRLLNGMVAGCSNLNQAGTPAGMVRALGVGAWFGTLAGLVYGAITAVAARRILYPATWVATAR